MDKILDRARKVAEFVIVDEYSMPVGIRYNSELKQAIYDLRETIIALEND